MPLLPLPVAAIELAQVGPNPHQYEGSALPIPRRRRDSAPAPTPAPAPVPAATAEEGRQAGGAAPDRLSTCLARAARDPMAGLADARAWLAEGANAEQRVRANQCLGLILAQQGQFDEAEQAFSDAVGGVPVVQEVAAVPLLAMAGNAALAGGHAPRAVDWFDRALAVKGMNDNAALGAIQIDRARALVATGSMAEAGAALDDAHRLAPEDPQGWLLSATLARRNKDLPRAQRDIEIAAKFDPADPAIGLEAGVIAVLDGRDEAARKSWVSVIKAAPQSEEAKTARGYLEQIGPAPTSDAPASPASAPPPKTEKKPS